MISRSGFIYEAGSGPQPPLRDVACQLARLPRWCGATKERWSVAQHSLVVASLLSDGPVELQLAGLLHDCEEALGWGDISSKLKTQEIKALQWRDRAHYVSLLAPTALPYLDSDRLHAADEAAAKAERYICFDSTPIDAHQNLGKLGSMACPKMLGYGYEGDWSEERIVNAFMKAYGDLTVHTLPDVAQRAVSRSLATASQRSDLRLIDSDAKFELDDAAAGAGVRRMAADDFEFQQCFEPFALDYCAVCGAAYPADSKHSCHPEASPNDGC